MATPSIAASLVTSKKLLAFYNANTAGAPVNKFSDRKTAERRCSLLAEELQAEKFTHAQIADAIDKGTALVHRVDPEDDDYAAAVATVNAAVATGKSEHADMVDHSASNAAIAKMLPAAKPRYPEGSMRAKLAAEIAQQTSIAPRPKKVDAPAATARPARVVISKVRATLTGTSVCQVGSTRARVLKAVQDAPDRTITVAALDAQLGLESRGYLQKLLEKGHIALVAA